jgi:hypothetical protein
MHDPPMEERRAITRSHLRVSELVFGNRGPRAILAWLDVGGVRTPLYLCDLDRAKLKRLPGARNTYLYEDETVDPRYFDARDVEGARS